MKDILWVKLPSSAYDKKDKIDDFFKEELGGEDLKVIVTYGECELVLFGKPIFIYPLLVAEIKNAI